ncbi:ubiquinol-cytochrome c reductase complex assembly factor 4 isoform X2 [Hippocampus comes]|uniref:Ubiquinol-cytochrome c reductase complex assembly factor 4 n=1 Tax=Hippocampus comes TaxID=109280 RepID=A0A3Q2Z1S9_HIPCM|nr:PREDICTED: protein CCSMST1 isoform X2 [Hippocampus comes]
MAHVFTVLKSRTFSRGTSMLIRHTNASMSVRPLTVSHHLLAKPNKPEQDLQEETATEPIRFSTSKASHRTWKVERSMGSQHQRPWWKVVPLSVIAVAFLLWCALREESDIDERLDKELYQHLPGLLSNQENEKNK